MRDQAAPPFVARKAGLESYVGCSPVGEWSGECPLTKNGFPAALNGLFAAKEVFARRLLACVLSFLFPMPNAGALHHARAPLLEIRTLNTYNSG